MAEGGERRARARRYAKGGTRRAFDERKRREEREVMQLRGKEQLDGDLEALEVRVHEAVRKGIRGKEGFRADRREALVIGDLLRDCRRHGIEIRVILGDGRTDGSSRLGEGRVLRGIQRRARGLGIEGFHGGHEHWHLGLGNVVDLLRHPGGWDHGVLRETGALQNELAQLWDGDPLHWVNLKDTAENTNHLGGERQNSFQEEGVLEVGLECGILNRGTFPWIATAG